MMRSILFCCLIFLLAACTHKEVERPKTDWSVSLKNDDKPYGLSLANRSLQYYFPSAKTEALSKQFRFTSIDEQMRYHPDSPALLAMVGLSFYTSKDEWRALLRFVREGNEVMIFSSRLDPNIQKSLHVAKVGYGEEMPLNMFADGSENRAALSLTADSSLHFGYIGHYIGGYFRLPEIDSTSEKKSLKSSSSVAESDRHYSSSSDDDDDEVLEIPGLDSLPVILGRSKSGPDFIRYKIGSGHLTLHAAPLALSNYFLLQDNNRAYLDGVWHTLPDNISVIYLHSYEKRERKGTAFSVLFKYPPIKAALIIAFFTLLLYVLFSLKKLQRRIAIVRPLPNESVSFVETIGRLYYNKGMHHNLAEKMIQHFLDWVRSNYYLNTSQLNETFAERLTAKSGKSRDEVNELLNMIHDLRLGAVADADYLLRIYKSTQSFYKN